MSPTSAAGAGSPTWRQRLLLIAFGLFLALLLLAGVESVLRLLGLGRPNAGSDPFVGFVPSRPLFSQRTLPDGREVYATNPDKLTFFNPQEFPFRKAAGTYRIFALGGSTTAGRPYDARVAFPRFLELYLDAAEPGRRHEVINAGALSYASYRIVVLMRELARYEPDAFVVYTGHNEFLEERTYAGQRLDTGVLGAARVALSRLRVYHWLRGARPVAPSEAGSPSGTAGAGTASERPSLADEVTTKLEGWTGLERYRRDPALARRIVEHFEYNLEEMVKIARQAGARLIFVTPASNLKDFSPFKSELGIAADSPQARRVQELVGAGRRALETGDASAARAALEEARGLDPAFAETHFRLGRALLALGRPQEAAAPLILARDLDVAPLRATTEVVETLEATVDRLGAPRIDLPALLAAEAQERQGHPLLGDEVFLDHVHPDIPVHARIADEILRRLDQLGEVVLDASWSAARRRQIDDAVVAGLDRLDYARRDQNLATVLAWSGKLEEAEGPLLRAARELPDDPDLRLDLGIVYQRTGRPEAAVQELRRAVELRPDDPAAHLNLGISLGAVDDLEGGVRALEEALRLRPDSAEASHNLGVLRRRAGDLAGAETALRRALELRPAAAETWNALGLVYRRQERWAEAETALRRSLELAPERATAEVDLGVTLASQGKIDEAGQRLERATRLAPASADAWYNLGLHRARSGDPSAAEEAYRRAIEADPTYALARNNLALLRVAAGDLQEASRQLVEAVAAAPDYPDAYFNLGLVYDAGGQPREAARAIEKAVELAPRNGRYHLALAALLEALGETERATFHGDEAERLGAGGPPG